MANQYSHDFLFFCSKHWSIDVAAVCCQRFDSLWILQKLNCSEVISILLKLHLNLPWNSCSMLPRARPFLIIRVFSNKKEKCLKALHSLLALISAISLHVHNATFLGTGAAHFHREPRESRVVMESNTLSWLLFSAQTRRNIFGWHERASPAPYTLQCP